MTTSIPSPSPAPMRPVRVAATLIVLRDGPSGLEVLMLRRAEKEADQNSGASVFPGGTLDAQDRALHALCDGVDDAAASLRLGIPVNGLDYYVAAVRECFEEAGLLFAGDADGRLVELDDMPSQELVALRLAVEEGGDALRNLCTGRGWRLAVERLAYFSHWLTPLGMPRRFDTRFFVALAPPRQSARPDGRETVEHMWLRPADAVDPARGLKLMNVQRRILLQLATFENAQACIEFARELREIPLVMPRIADGPAGRRPVNPGEPAYDELSRIDPDGLANARYELASGLAMQLSPRVLRVTALRGEALVNSYFVGGDRNEWVLIDAGQGDECHAATVRASAPGPVRWTLAIHGEPLPHGHRIDLGGCTLRVLHQLGREDALACFLLEEEKTLFAADAGSSTALDAGEVEWIAPFSGFLIRR
ncbi:NUDIX domain-containing protein [Variovorax sp. J2P1-59]|uniref:NUDIX domain-containing protein n=1 Tax=Variovorax flavidus TaxID=3053501 RepID=UPI00257669B1|nr:NUDIX domain-containing protein [Variovorax sp. J2P1-59]MDM0073214.1 NUDIX domain-containing protein [Variovorax sp. J2P1-59]